MERVAHAPRGIPASPREAERLARELLSRWQAETQLLTSATLSAAPPPVPAPPSTVEPTSPSSSQPSPRARKVSRRRTTTLLGLPTGWVSSVALGTAYLGIAGLTVGTTLMIWGHFGAVPGLSPLGWLLISLGQMGLFLGLLTLVACWFEHTQRMLKRRLKKLHRRFIATERAAQDNRSSRPRQAA
ncbi:MAG: hypothetical protein KatS3mg113_1106 [Planctomycetaceae bacterium]|nr:MAG: hypothetical protein KatS3mg113_1106 [Planctomycetaceae bacterium]